MRQWAGGLVVTTDNKVALQQRDDKPGITLPGYVAMFGGTVEEGEDVKAAAIREFEEELTIRANRQKLSKLGIYRKTKEIDGEDYLIHVFVVRDINPKLIKVREGKCAVFIDGKNDLSDLKLTRITRLALRDFFAKDFQVEI